MVVGGFQKVSLSDYPGLISSIVFTQGCNFRCPWCHNPDLVDPSRFGPSIPWDEVLAFLQSRTGRVEGVVVTGGEPTVHADLPDRLAELKCMGFQVKLDTNGSNPRMLRHLLETGLLDFVSMDVKAPLYKYEEAAGRTVSAADIAASINLVLGSSLPHEFRTTLLPMLATEDLHAIGALVRGCQRFVLQEFRPGRTLLPGYGSPAAGREVCPDRAASSFTGSSASVAAFKDAVGHLAASGLEVVARL